MVIRLDGLSEKEKKAQLEFAFLFPKSFELIKQEGRVEGAISEVKSIILALDKCNNLFEINQFLEKRLKELEQKGGN